MGNFRFFRRKQIFPGLSINLSASGPSLSLGVRGAHVTFGQRGVRRTVGIPGSGIYWTSSTGYHSGVHSAHVDAPVGGGAQAAAHVSATFVVLAILLAPVAVVLAFYAAKFVVYLLLGIGALSAVAGGVFGSSRKR